MNTDNDGYTYLTSAVIYYELGNINKCIKSIKTYFREFKNSKNYNVFAPIYRSFLVFVFAKNNNPKEALKYHKLNGGNRIDNKFNNPLKLHEMITIAPNSLYYDPSFIEIWKQNLLNRKTFVGQCVLYDSFYSWYIYALSCHYRKYPSYEEAIQCYLKTIELRPYFGLGFYQLSKLYFEIERYELSLKYLNKSYKINPFIQEIKTNYINLKLKNIKQILNQKRLLNGFIRNLLPLNSNISEIVETYLYYNIDVNVGTLEHKPTDENIPLELKLYVL